MTLSKLFTISLSFLVLITGFVFADLDQEVNDIQNNAENRLNSIEYDLQNATQTFYKSKEELDVLEKALAPLKDKRATLENQLQIFEDQLTLASTKIQNLEIQINKKRLEIAQLQELLDRAQIEIQEETDHALEFMKQLYFEEKMMFSQNSTTPDLVKLLLLEGSVSQNIQNLSYLETVQLLSQSILQRLEKAMFVFADKKELLEEKNATLVKLKNSLLQEKQSLVLQKQAREKLLAETKGQETEYQKLLAESKKQSEDSLLAIANLRDNRLVIQKQLETLGSVSDTQHKAQQEQVLQSILDNPLEKEYDLDQLVEDSIYSSPLMWPISPTKGLSATFHDPDYKEYFGVPHSAIDIRAAQGTNVYAAASAYVQEVKDAGLGYSYILLAHENGLSTLYGHMSEILISQGELIQFGQIIGKSGGMPGTKGAGLMTTGPHLHFEVHQDGVAVNPLGFLPRELLR